MARPALSASVTALRPAMMSVPRGASRRLFGCFSMVSPLSAARPIGGAPGVFPAIDILCNHYSTVPWKTQIKKREKWGFSQEAASLARGSIFSVYFSKECKKILFSMPPQKDFSTGMPGVTCVSHRECGKLCGNCEKPLSLCGFQLSPVSTRELFYVNKPFYFSFLKQKTLFFKIGKCPNIQKKRESCPLYLVSSGNGKNLFPQTVHRDLTYISPRGVSRGCSGFPQEKAMLFPGFVVY